MLKDMKVVYAAGFVLMTLFGAYYYQDILFQPLVIGLVFRLLQIHRHNLFGINH